MTITSIKGIQVGHYTHSDSPTGCTVILCPSNTVGGVDVRGASPGTRETDLLDPTNTVQYVNAIVLSGGSAYGLDTATGVMRYLESKGIGLKVGNHCIPIVPAAVIFDLNVSKTPIRPDTLSGYLACKNANSDPVIQGNVGAGTGATVSKVFGNAVKGGLGSSLIEVGPWQVGALVVVNALGDIVDPTTGNILVGSNVTTSLLEGKAHNQLIGSNTTIGVIVTNAKLDKAQVKRLAMSGHNGLARAIRPSHTPYDGDTLFGLATGECELEPDLMLLSTMASEAVAKAIVNAVRL